MIKLREVIDRQVIEWDKAIAGASTEKIGLRLLRDKKRWLCKNDLFYLCCLTGWSEIAKYPDFYKPFCDEVSLITWQVVKLNIHKPTEELLPISAITDNPDEDLKYLQRLYLCYRTFYKTTIITKVNTLQLLLNFNNIHIIFCHNKFDNASANLVAVKEMFLNTYINTIFPECVPSRKDWGSARGFSLANRTDKGRDEDSVMAAGVDTEITGGHWQIAKKNDLVTEASVNTDEQIKKTKDWDDRFNIGHFDDPQFKLQDYEGTRYHFGDLYSYKKGDSNIRQKEVVLVKNLDKFIAGDDEQIMHPERFTRKGILSLMSNMWVFMCQMQQNPHDPSKMEFNESMIVYYDAIPSGGYNFLLVDPASARKKKSDFTVMLVIKVAWFKFPHDDAPKLRRFIIDGVRDKLNPKQRVDSAINLADKWKISGCAWEAITFQDSDCYYFEEARRAKQIFFHPTKIKHHNTAKEDRIKALIPDYAQHLWVWPAKGKMIRRRQFDSKNYDMTEELEKELREFPLCEHDDLFDAQTFLNRMKFATPEKHEDNPVDDHMTFGDYAGNMDRKRKDKLNRDPYTELIESRV